MLYNSGKVQYAGASASPALLDPFPPVNRSNESDNVTRINQKRVHNKPIYTSEVVQASDLESGAKSTFLSR